ncbi:MAG: LysR family transcriptional regulator [Chloroflexi bacterium]|nr:LysR family transcriptional regulator [Chloroflexota bacterium]OJW06830.1 MAG: hypothetical protein BGO39_23855 [Chloroflexi bacterium 54-19]
MELRHLRYFITVAEELNFVRAARRLNIVQPALSKQIHDLEKELGFPLFSRKKRQIQLTPAGYTFLEGARQTLATADQAILKAVRSSRGQTGRLVVGYSSLVYCHLLPRILQSFRQRNPQVELVLLDLNTGQQIEKMLNSQIDIGFYVHLPGILAADTQQKLRSQTIVLEPTLVGVPADHPLAGTGTVKLAQLANDPWLFFSRQLEPQLYDNTYKIFEKAGFIPQVTQEVVQQWFAVRLVAAGFGVSAFPSSAISMGVGEVEFLEIGEPQWLTNFCILWHSDNGSPLLKAFLDTVNTFVAGALDIKN